MSTEVVNERAATYGHPYDNFKDIVALKEVVAKCSHSLVRHALEMICVKIGRAIYNPTHLDTLVDIAGYAQTAIMCLEEEQRRMKTPTVSALKEQGPNKETVVYRSLNHV